ncbi:MAG: hypothetical protein ACK413_02700 [Patescibacteria group bacterium]
MYLILLVIISLSSYAGTLTIICYPPQRPYATGTIREYGAITKVDRDLEIAELYSPVIEEDYGFARFDVPNLPPNARSLRIELVYEVYRVYGVSPRIARWWLLSVDPITAGPSELLDAIINGIPVTREEEEHAYGQRRDLLRERLPKIESMARANGYVALGWVKENCVSYTSGAVAYGWQSYQRPRLEWEYVTGIEEENKDELFSSIYPNPVNKTEFIPPNVSLYDIMGRQVFNLKRAGIYFILDSNHRCRRIVVH